MKIKRLSPSEQQEIIRLYTEPLEDGTWLGAQSIAKQFKCSPQSVRNALARHGIPTRGAKESHAHGKRCKPIKNLPIGNAPACKCGCGTLTEWNRRKNCWNRYAEGHYRKNLDYHNAEWLHQKYVIENMTAKEIADMFGVVASAVIKSLVKNNIPRRNGSESLKGRMGGSKNPSWKGGTTPERQRLYKSEEWKCLVKTVIARDSYRCQRCGHNSGFHTHHITPWHSTPSLRKDLDNLITLCVECHIWVHSLNNVDRWFFATPVLSGKSTAPGR